MAGLQLAQNFINLDISRCMPANAKKAEQLGIDTKIAPQLIAKVAAFQADVNKLDQAAKGSHNLFDALNNASQPQNQQIQDEASFSAAKSTDKIQEIQEDRLQSRIDTIKAQMVQSLIESVDLYKLKSYSGDFSCFKKLIDIAHGKFDTLQMMLAGDVDLSEVILHSQKSVEELAKDSPEYPVLLEMIMKSQLISESQYSELQDAPAKMMNNAAHSEKAMMAFKRLLNSGQVRLEDFAERAVELDPTSAIVSLVKLGLSSARKDQRLSVTKILSKVAKESAGTMAGSMAAKGLKKIIKSEGENGVLREAFSGLKESAMAGNKESLKGLKDLAVDPTVSTNKAFKAIECLTEVASSSSNAGSEATDILVGVANDKKVSPKVRMKSVDGLTDVVKSGNANANKAASALVKLAQNPIDPVGNRALKNILSLDNTEKFDQNDLSKVLFGAAKNKKLDNKDRISAYNKLEQLHDRQGAGSHQAKGLILDLARTPDDQVGKRALKKVASMNESNKTKSKDTGFLMNQFQPQVKFKSEFNLLKA